MALIKTEWKTCKKQT